MDLIEFNINGEVLIPLENSNFLSQKKDITYKDLKECTYNLFRNVLFQGELIKFYILLKPDNMEPSKIKSFLENLYFKIDFESTGALNINEQMKNQEDGPENSVNDLFTTNTEKINEKNYEYENVERKEYDEDEKLELYELYKQIVVPKSFLNVPLIMKLEILEKNEDAIDFKESSDTFFYYKIGYFDNVQKFKTLKTLFKEVQVIKPLDICETKQIDLTLEMSLLQIKLNNVTANADYEDISLKKSKFIKKALPEEEEKFHFGNDIIINEIEILEDETTIDEKETEKVDLVKRYLRRKNLSMQKDINFKLILNNFPLKLQPGEYYNLSVKVKKNSFLTDSEIKGSNDSSYEIEDPNTANESLSTLGNILNPQNNSSANLNLNSTINLATQSNTNNIPDQVQPLPPSETKVLQSSRKRLNSNAIVISRKSIFNQAKERLVSFSNVTNPLYTESNIPISEIQKTHKTEGQFLREFRDSNIKIYYITPVLLYISSKMFYENLFMCLQLKWYQDLNRLLKIELKIPEQIFLYEYFDVRVKIRNISNMSMNLLIEMKENEDSGISDKVNNFEYMPALISEIKFQSLGMFNRNEDKIFNLRFLTTKLGFTQLPNFAITDTFSNRRFYIVQNNKIFIRENPNKGNSVNVLNHLISTTINN